MIKIYLTPFLCLIILYLELGAALPTEKIFTYYVNKQEGDRYFFEFDAGQFQTREERGELVTKGNKKILTVKGFYTFLGTDGKVHQVDYQADENGFKAKKSTNYPPQEQPIPGPVLASLSGGDIG